MFFKDSFNLFVVGLFVVGLFVVFFPQSASAGAATGLGCCINNGGNCNPGCGSEGDDCFRDFDAMGNAPCPDEQVSSCGGLTPTNKGCFIEGLTCLQVSNSKGECVPAGEENECDGEDASLCPNPDSTCLTPVCENNFCGLVATGDPSCESAGPVAIIPTMGQWGMIIAAVFLGIFAIIRLRSIKDSELS